VSDSKTAPGSSASKRTTARWGEGAAAACGRAAGEVGAGAAGPGGAENAAVEEGAGAVAVWGVVVSGATQAGGEAVCAAALDAKNVASAAYGASRREQFRPPIERGAYKSWGRGVKSPDPS
jgi:hypothetical protein